MYIQTSLDLTSLNDIEERISNASEVFSNKLITNGDEGNFLIELQEAFKECLNFYFSVAFINFSGLQLILEDLKSLEEKGVSGKIITSTYLNFTEVNALKKLKTFSNIDLSIFISDEKMRGFHTKVYVFEYKDYYKIFIGSSNLTQSALKSSEEWNVLVKTSKTSTFALEVLENFNRLEKETVEVTNSFLEKYSEVLKSLKGNTIEVPSLENFKVITPNIMQRDALDNLHILRAHGEKRALIIAATGTGKTFLSAFDVKRVKPKKMLFIVHREDILRKAIEDYKKVIKNISFGLFTGNIKERDKNYIFATIQSMAAHYETFKRDEFDYIIIDEAHHSASNTYKKVINYFKPKFLLGMTATPERTEGLDIFSIYHNNIAHEVRLYEALEENLVVPFHYFGITDIEAVNYAGIDLNDIAKVSKLLQLNERVDFIIEKLDFYGFDGEKMRAVGFCANIEHANYMAKKFNERGIKSVALVGTDSINRRQNTIKKLESDNDNLEVIFTVDLFNEGVDIPSINLVLMLRPTQSSIVFIQQLGRGLRKFKNKEFLTVLDFIGNYNKAFQIAIALNGANYYDKESLKTSIKTNFLNIKGCTNIQMDKISKERILEQIDKENFNNLKYLKEEYMEFKKINGGKPVNLLTDYYKYEGSFNPLKFIKATSNKTYLGFLEKVDKDFKDTNLLEDENFKLVLKDITSKLPLKRPFEFIILKYLIEKGSASREELISEIKKYIDKLDLDTFNYTLECLRGDYYSKKESNFNFIIDREGEIYLAEELNKASKDEKMLYYIEDVLNYGLLSYEREFGKLNYGVPFLKIYSQYSRDDVVRMSNAKKKFSGYGMGGLKTNGKQWFLFVGMEKEEDLKESLNHKNIFLDNETFVWESRNTTTIDSKAGQELIYNRKHNIDIHLFIRKYREIDGVIEPYIYMGKADTIAYKGEKPIIVNLKLQNKVPMRIYNELL